MTMRDVLLKYGFKKHFIPNLYVKDNYMYKAVILKGNVYIMKYIKKDDKYVNVTTVNSKNNLIKVLQGL